MPVRSARGPFRSALKKISTVKKLGERAGEDVKPGNNIKKTANALTCRNASSKVWRNCAPLSIRAGGQRKVLVIAEGDGSFCNRTVLAAIPERSVLIARARRDAKLCSAAAPGGRRLYAEQKFTPDDVRQDEKIAWKTTKIFYGGKRRKVRYKEVTEVLWQSGAKTRHLRLFVIAPTPYRKRKSAKLYYRQPAFLLCTDLTSSASQLLQIYFDRWLIEVNHREEKDALGIGQAQLWNPLSVPRQASSGRCRL